MFRSMKEKFKEELLPFLLAFILLSSKSFLQGVTPALVGSSRGRDILIFGPQYGSGSKKARSYDFPDVSLSYLSLDLMSKALSPLIFSLDSERERPKTPA